MGFTKEDKQFISSEIKNCEANLLQQIGDLRSQVQTLNEENAELRRHLITADRRIDDLESSIESSKHLRRKTQVDRGRECQAAGIIADCRIRKRWRQNFR